jgi:phosphoserine phosphatase RsbU/P
LLGTATQPERPSFGHRPGSSNTAVHATEAAAILIANLFAQGDRDVPGVSYAVAYRLAEVHTGGDIVDVYQFNNNAVALSIADISGKGAEAAVHAALIKYGLRAYASHGLTPEKTMRAMDRLYLENSTFESAESFATVFLGVVDARRRVMTYSSAAHEPVVIVQPNKEARVLPPTAPLIGVFDDQSHLFNEDHVELWPGTLFVATTDGVTEVRNAAGQLFGMRRLIECIEAHREEEPAAIVDAVLTHAMEFSRGVWHDDIAIIAARFLDR